MKAQAAMEYLMTYGWALLIVVIVGVALWSLGVFNVGAGSTPKMTGISSLQLLDANATGSDVTLVFGTTRKMSGMTLTFTNSGNGADTNCTPSATIPNPVNPSKRIQYTCNNWDGSTIDVSLSYKDPYSGLTHKETGTITGLSS